MRAAKSVLAAVEALPAAGVLVTFRINQPHDPRFEQPLSFAARQAPPIAAEDVIYSAFVQPGRSRPSRSALARLPHAKPEVAWPHRARRRAGRDSARARLCAGRRAASRRRSTR